MEFDSPGGQRSSGASENSIRKPDRSFRGTLQPTGEDISLKKSSQTEKTREAGNWGSVLVEQENHPYFYSKIRREENDVGRDFKMWENGRCVLTEKVGRVPSDSASP